MLDFGIAGNVIQRFTHFLVVRVKCTSLLSIEGKRSRLLVCGRSDGIGVFLAVRRPIVVDHGDKSRAELGQESVRKTRFRQRFRRMERMVVLKEVSVEDGSVS